MKAVTAQRYGSAEVLELTELPRPVPGEGEVLVRVRAASVNAADLHIMHGRPLPIRLMFGLTRPRIKAFGVDAAGEVEGVGRGVTDFAPGDAVFGDLSGSGCGAFAEYVSAPAAVFARVPKELDFPSAATIPVAGVTALQALRDHGGISAGHEVLVIGASGGVGSFAVQLAKHLGARVTGVCRTEKTEMVRGLGADAVVDRTREDAARTGRTYDIILDAGAYRSIFDYTDSLSPAGRYVLAGGSMTQLLQAATLGALRSSADGKRYLSFLAKPNSGDLDLLADLMARGDLNAAVSRRFALTEAIGAVRRLESGAATGKILIESV